MWIFSWGNLSPALLFARRFLDSPDSLRSRVIDPSLRVRASNQRSDFDGVAESDHFSEGRS